jgi:hypothetical protein
MKQTYCSTHMLSLDPTCNTCKTSAEVQVAIDALLESNEKMRKRIEELEAALRTSSAVTQALAFASFASEDEEE